MDLASVKLGLALAELRNAVFDLEGKDRPPVSNDPDKRWTDGHHVGLLYGYKRSIAEIEHALGLDPSES